MSKSSESSPDEEPKSVAEIVVASTTKLTKDNVDAIPEALSASDSIETEEGSFESRMDLGTKQIEEGKSGLRNRSKTESNAGGGADTPAQGIPDHYGRRVGRGRADDTGSPDHDVPMTEHEGETEAGHRSVGSSSASAIFRSSDQLNQLLEKNSPNHEPFELATDNASILERTESSESRRREFVEETDNGDSKTLEIFAFSSAGPETVAGQKKRPDTLATVRWKNAYLFVKKENAMRKKALCSPIGTGATLHGHALGFLSIHNETRTRLFAILYNEKTEYALFFIIMTHLLVLVLKAEKTWTTSFHPSNLALNIADVVLTSVYTVECICRIITLGFFRGPHAYLRSKYNILDFVIVVDSWVHIIRTLVLQEDGFVRLGVLRLLRALLVLREVSFVGNVFATLDAIVQTIPPLKFVIIMMMMFFLCYSSLGEFYFNSLLRRRCIRKQDREPTFPVLPCSINYKAHAGDTHVHMQGSCAEDQGLICALGDNPNYGVSNFENIGAIYLMLIQITTFEGWSALMIQTRVASNSVGADVYFIVMVIVGGYFMVNVIIAAVSGVYLRVRQEHQMLLRKYRREKAFSFSNAIKMAGLLKEVIIRDDEILSWRQRLMRRTSRLSRQLTHSFSRESSWLRSSVTRAVDWRGSISSLRRISSFGLTMLDDDENIYSYNSAYRLSFGRSLSNGIRFGRSMSRSFSLTSKRWEQKLSLMCRVFANSKVFTYGVLFLISFNTVLTCTLSAKSSRRLRVAVETTQVAMVGILWVEILVRFIGFGFTEFVSESVNLLDLFNVVISTMSLKFTDIVPNILCMRLMHWFHVKGSKARKRGDEDSTIMVAISRSLPAVSSVFFFFFLNIMITSVLSAELWGGHMNLNSRGTRPRGNYDTLPQAMLLWFTVTTGESWVNQMWNVLRPGMKHRWAAPVFFLPYYISTAIFTINLIIAAILEETELTDYQKKFIQKICGNRRTLLGVKRDHIKWLQVKHIRRLSNTRSADLVMGIFEGFKGVKRRLSSMRTSRLPNLPSPTVQNPQEKRTDDTFTPTDGSSKGVGNFEGVSTQVAPDVAVCIPGSGAVDGMRSLPGVSPRIFSYNPAGMSDAAGHEHSKVKTSRRSSTSVLTNIPPAALQLPSRRRLSLAADGLYLRSGFKGNNLATGVEKEPTTALQDALLAVANQQLVVAKQAEDSMKSKTSPELVVYGSRKSRNRGSFLLADFEGIQSVEETVTPWWLKDRSLFLFQSGNRIRLLATKVIQHPAYEWWEVMWCAWSVVVMIETDTRGKLTGRLHFLNFVDLAVFSVFLSDLVLKSIAYGFLFTREAYLEDPYNWVDVSNLIFHVLFLKEHEYHGTNSFAKTSLILTAWRPFRFISRFRNLRILNSCILRTIPAVTHVLLFTIVIYVIFALIGMEIFSNKFRECTDPAVFGHVDCVGMFHNEVGLLAPRTWVNPPFHFDAFGPAMLSLFVCSTLDNWLLSFLYRAMDIGGLGKSPRRNASPSYAIYFVVFVSVGGFFVLRMFVGVLIDQFGLMSGTKLLTERQKLWRDTNRLIQSLRPIRPPAVVTGMWIRRVAHKIVYNRIFEYVVVLLVTSNYIVYAAMVFNITGLVSIQLSLVQKLEYFYISSSLVEVALKLLGTELRDWWYDKWNVLELVLVLTTSATRLLKNTSGKVNDVGLFFASVKVFRIIRYISPVRTALVTVGVSLPSMVDITALMGIFLFALAQIGTQVFYVTKEGVCIRNNGRNSFQTWSSSFVLLLQITTLDNWSCLLVDLTLSPPYCIPGISSFESECGFPVWGTVYLLISVCITNYIFGNLFIAKILDSITFGLLNEDALVKPSHLEAYRKVWANDGFDRRCTGFIPHHKLKEFLIQLGYPLGGKRHGFVKWFSRIEYETFHFRSAKGVPFRSLLETIVLYKIGSRGLELPVRIARGKHIEEIYQKGAATKIQGLIRGFLQRRRNKKSKIEETEKNDEKQVKSDEDHTRVSEDQDNQNDEKKRDSENSVRLAEDPTLARPNYP